MKKGCTNRGFTFIEVLISLAIFGVAIALMMSVMSGGLLNITHASKKTSDEFTAQKLMDAALADPAHFSDPQGRVVIEPAAMPAPANDYGASSISGYKITVVVNNVELISFTALSD